MSAEIQSAVASVHGLSVRRKLRVGIYSQAALRQFIVQQLTHRGGRRHLARRSRALRAPRPNSGPNRPNRSQLAQTVEAGIAGAHAHAAIVEGAVSTAWRLVEAGQEALG